MVTFWSWQTSCAHFNASITVGQLIYSLDSLSKQSIIVFLSIISAQIAGGMLGILLSFNAMDELNPNENQKELRPGVPYLCPAASGFNCDKNGYQQQVFRMELFGSSMFVFCWILIKHHQSQSNLQVFVKPLLISFAYSVCLIFGITTSGGPLNSSFALSLHIWNLIFYNNDNHVDNDP